MASVTSSQGISRSEPSTSVNLVGRPFSSVSQDRSTTFAARRFPFSSPKNSLVLMLQCLWQPSSCEVVVFNNMGYVGHGIASVRDCGCVGINSYCVTDIGP